LRQLRVIVPALAGTALALVGGLGLSNLWQLNHATWWGAGAVAAALAGVLVATLLIAWAYAGPKSPKVRIGGPAAAQMRGVINDKETFPLDPSQFDPTAARTKLETIASDTRHSQRNALLKVKVKDSGQNTATSVAVKPIFVTPDEYAVAYDALNHVLSQRDPTPNTQTEEAAKDLLSLQTEWEDAFDQARNGVWEKRSNSRSAIAIIGAVLATALLPLSIWLALTGAEKDAQAEKDVAKTVKQEDLDAAQAAKVKELDAARAVKTADAIAVTRVTPITVYLSDSDGRKLNDARGECKTPLAFKTGIDADAIGGTWERPIIVVTGETANATCKTVSFRTEDPVGMYERGEAQKAARQGN
jgi:hypothetical protein